MSISTKGKRKLVFGDKIYIWHVSPDYDRADLRKNYNVLHVIAKDKSLELYLPLEKMNPIPDTVSPSLVKDMIKQALVKGEES